MEIGSNGSRSEKNKKLGVFFMGRKKIIPNFEAKKKVKVLLLCKFYLRYTHIYEFIQQIKGTKPHRLQ